MNTDQGRILIVDDKKDVLAALRLLLQQHVSVVHTARDPAAIPALLADDSYDVILLDMNFSQDASSGREGFAWLRHIRQIDPTAAVILITAYGDIEKAVHAMKEGALDFITKPWKNEKLVTTVKNAIKLRQSRLEAQRLQSQQERLSADLDRPYQDIIGQSAAMERVFETIDKVATTDANVLILGENGTGKELIARALHRRSARADEVFISVDLGALTASLFESELFGYVKGAFTGADADRPGRFEVAAGGSLFLDEIGNISAAQQAKLLTVLQRREVLRVGATRPHAVDVRLIAATNQPIYDMIRSGAFRQDLLYRINTVEILLPPLRERQEDVPLLVEHFIGVYTRKYQKPIEGVSEAAMDRLQAYRWPGNVRELQHAVERAVILSDGPLLRPSDFSLFATPSASDHEAALESLNLDTLEQLAVRKALSKHGGNISRAAAELGISRKALYRRIEKYGL